MDSLFSISPPENFDFSDFANWPNWIRRFERFRVAAGLDKKDESYQVNSLVYAMGDKADDILSMLNLSVDDVHKYKAVKEAFDKYFICKHNVIYCMRGLVSIREFKSQVNLLKLSSLQFINWQSTVNMALCKTR